MRSSVAIREHLDVFEARWLVQRVARVVGFAARDTAELVVVASELATNILKFAPPGGIEAAPVESPDLGVGIRITAHDVGPPFDDLDGIVARSTVVGVAIEWTGRGLGGGLGAVYRFTDVLRCAPHGSGKAIVVERYVRRPRRPG